MESIAKETAAAVAEASVRTLDITFSPPKHIVLHGVQKTTMADLLNAATMGVEPGGIGRPLTVIGDVVFFFSELPITEATVGRYLGGTLDILQVVWAQDPDFVAGAGGIYENKISKVKVPLISQDRNWQFRAVVDFLKGMDKEEAKEGTHVLGGGAIA